MEKKIPVRENTRFFFQNTGKIGNYLILKIHKFHNFFFPNELNVSAKFVLLIKHPEITEIGTCKICDRTGKTQGI